NAYFNQLGEGLGAVVPPQVTSLARKPLSIAMEEIAAGKVRAGAPDQGEVIDSDSDVAQELAALAALAEAEVVLEDSEPAKPEESGDASSE
ncbi:MAG TPA: DNA-directed RNA polymerase subunit omega, partial [Acidimicrobiales bacterium]|nr:DNA-directed RNA polymerase subunit omega [Acidimicrobiales bacterium]